MIQVLPLLTRSCTITTRTPSGDLDAYGDELADMATTDTVCELQQRQRTEPGQQAETSDTSWLLVLPPATLIDTGDAVTVDGVELEVTGDPWRVRHPRTGIDSHIECTVRRTAGQTTA